MKKGVFRGMLFTCLLFFAVQLQAQSLVSTQEYEAMLSESFIASNETHPDPAQASLNLTALSETAIHEFAADWVQEGRQKHPVIEIAVTDQPGYPKYRDTGNPEKDSEAFEAAVKRWNQGLQGHSGEEKEKSSF